MTDYHNYHVEFFTADGLLLHIDNIRSPMDHWTLCGYLLSNMPSGTDDFRVTEIDTDPEQSLRDLPLLCA